MFNPTKAHSKWIADNQYKIRMGNRVPDGAVSLAYSHVTPLNARDNVQIADLSGFVLENISGANVRDIKLWPSHSHLLQTTGGDSIIPARNFLLTDVFKDDKPLYYMYECKFPIVDSEGPDVFGFYKGSSISLIDRSGQRLSDSYTYRVVLVETDVPNQYKVRVFTDFQTQPSDNIRVIYTALKDGTSIPGTTEAVTPQPAFHQTSDIDGVINNEAPHSFYQASGLELGESQVYVSRKPIRNSDYRTPVDFNFVVSVTYTDGTVDVTPEISESVYNANSVTEADTEYANGFKRLHGWTAEEFLTAYDAFDNMKTVDYFSVVTTNPNVEIYTQPDGQNYVIASTQVDTGQIVLPPAYRVITENGEIYYSPTYSIRLSDNSQIKAAEPIQTSAKDSWFVRVKNGRFKKEASNSAGFPVNYHYSVPEYYTQAFSKEYGMPYRQVKEERPMVIGERKIRVRYSPLYIKQDNGIYNAMVIVNGVPAVIKGWDSLDGSIELDTKVKENDTILVTYFYEENYFTYRGYWDEKNQRFWSLDLNPSHGHMYTDLNGETGEIVDVPTFGLINKTVYLYIRPSAMYGTNGLMIKGSHQLHTIFHTFEELDDADAVLLSKIRIRPNSSIENVRLVDVRKRGGGLKENISRELMRELNPDSEYYWDIGFWDGEPYSENGVAIIRVPKFILQEHGGRFTRAEAEAIVKRHLGYGNLPIIEFVDEPERLLGSPINTTLDIIAVEE